MRLLTLVFALLVLAWAGPAYSGEWLITPEEAARIAPPDFDYSMPLAAVEGPGPKIVVKDPGLIKEVVVPVDILVEFQPGESGLPPAMDTLTVTVIGFFDFDITDRVAKYITGDKLDVQQAELPTGNHRLRLSIRDTGGNINERDMDIVIKKK